MLKEIYHERGDVRVKAQHKLNGILNIDIEGPHIAPMVLQLDASIEEYEMDAFNTLRSLGDALQAVAGDILIQLPTTLPTGDDPQADEAMGSAKTDEDLLGDEHLLAGGD